MQWQGGLGKSAIKQLNEKRIPRMETIVYVTAHNVIGNDLLSLMAGALCETLSSLLHMHRSKQAYPKATAKIDTRTHSQFFHLTHIRQPCRFVGKRAIA